MAALDNKFHIKLDSNGYTLDRGGKAVYAYQKKRASQFVNKFGSGDSSYRDATFWQFWAQINWRNGCKQEKWGDGGKFWKSQNIDTTQVEQIKLSKNIESAGQVEAGAKVLSMAAWRTSQSWWNSNYGYRKQLTITAPSTSAVPVNYPIVVTEDTAALQTASKVRSDRKDWRVVYWNGSAWVDLDRHYVSSTKTVFGLQAAISSSATDNNYYLYYGYSGESTDKQPTTDAAWNGIYGFYGATPDANTLGVWHFQEGSGTTVVDQDSTFNLTTNSMGYTSTSTRYGYMGAFDNSDTAGYTDSSNDFNLGSLTVEMLVRPSSPGSPDILVIRRGGDDTTTQWDLYMNGGTLVFAVKDSGGTTRAATSSVSLSNNTTYWVAGTFDGSSTIKVYVNAVQTGSAACSSMISRTSDMRLYVGGKAVGGSDTFNGDIAHVRISNVERTSFPYVLATEPSLSVGSEITTQPPASTFTLFAGTDTGKIYSWDGTTTWTLAKNCNLLEEYATGYDADYLVGDTSNTEYKYAQSFQFTKAINVKSIEAYLKATATTPSGDITVRIETNNAGVPSGTLADANATGSIANFATTSYEWKTCTFATAFQLAATTTYWIVLSVAAQATDVGFSWGADNSSSAYASGTAATHNGSWTANSTRDMYFRVNSTDTSVNVLYVSSVGGTQKLYAGLGKITSQITGDARLVTYDGSSWALDKTFNTPSESQVLSLSTYSDKLYAGVGPQAKIYETSNATTWTLSKDIDFPQRPGYPYALKEYNSQLIAMGGSPEFLPAQNYDGFAFVYNGTVWQSLYPFDHTVLKSAEFYDAFLFMGTYHGQIYTYNTAFLDPLFSFKDDFNYNVSISAMKYFDDKLYFGTYPQTGSNETNVGLWVFDRHGITLTGYIPSITGITAIEQVNNVLMIGTGDSGHVYKVNQDAYPETGWLQTSYFDANLPSIPKLWDRIELNFDPLSNGNTIGLEYRFKESDSWTALTPTVAQAAGDTASVFSFPAATDSKKVSIKIILNTTNPLTSPVLREFIVRYSLFPVTKWQWSLRIKTKSPLQLADGTVDPRTAEEMRTELESLLSDPTLHTYTDIDGTTHQVLFYDLDETSWVINQDDSSGSSVPITIIEA